MFYDHRKIEPKWQKYWQDRQLFKAEIDPNKPKYYILDMFPYPSSAGLHVGHPEGYTATDILSRYKRTRGFNVLHPMGWDAFGLPAEQYALKTGIHPAETTKKAIDNFRRQLQTLGFSYDWNREISTCDPSYYRWTQSIFLKLYERGLAYQKEVPVNWCPELKTVLANEEVVDGKSERGGHPVYRIPMKQWMLKITDYAERLLQDLDDLDWPESTKDLQRHWIGKSEGLRLSFATNADSIEVFTTRPDTIFGVTFLVLAPEHPLVEKLVTAEARSAVKAYQEQSAQKSEMARQDQSKSKTGVFLGATAIHPFTGADVPIWISDYVMMGYGTGAVMAVPAHDQRDFEFARHYGLPIRTVVRPVAGEAKADEAFSGEGISVDSDFITGKPTAEAKALVIARAEEKKIGTKTTQYKLRDWLFSRQRYWGEPFPILRLEDGSLAAVDESHLPVVLPDVKSYEPSGTGESPLAGILDWVNTVDPKTGKPAKRETDTMPGSAGSSWYFFRYCDPHNESAAFSSEAEKYWMPVDLYLGGPEHAVGHLLYARFWTKVLFDAGVVSCKEPFKKLVHQGMILGEDGEKMSKSRGNVINPDDVVFRYGADTLRLYEMFMGPLERDKPWSTGAIEGVYRFLQRSWRLFFDDQGQPVFGDVAVDEETTKLLHQTIQKVTEDIEALRFNTAISQLMVFVNHLTKYPRKPQAVLKPFVQLLNPFAPHLAQELWSEVLREKAELSFDTWPSFDASLAQENTLTLAIQVMGKTRGTVSVAKGAEQADVEKQAREIDAVKTQLDGKTVTRVIFVKDRILNFIVK